MNLPLNPTVTGLACVRCGATSTDPWQWTCPEGCHPEARMDVQYADSAYAILASRLAGRARDHWRYAEILPVHPDGPRPPLQVGWTPVVHAPRLAARLGVRGVVLKDDGRNPSASLKDRASSVAVALAMASGAARVACASTGNAASSLACMAASVGLPATIFVPRRAPTPKVAQLRAFGAQVFRVDADYDATWELCAAVIAELGRQGGEPWFNRNCAVNPYLVEGKKTVALELAEQLGPDMPEWVALSVGDGCTVAGAVKGLEEAAAAGLISAVPRVLAVQAAGSAPLYRAFHEGAAPSMDGAETAADSICVGHPRNPDKALQAVRRNGGTFVVAEDDAILAYLVHQASDSGVFGEPAAAAATAGVAAAVAQGVISPDERVAIVVSGNGLKDPATALRAVTGPTDVPADVTAVLQLLGADPRPQ